MELEITAAPVVMPGSEENLVEIAIWSKGERLMETQIGSDDRIKLDTDALSYNRTDECDHEWVPVTVSHKPHPEVSNRIYYACTKCPAYRWETAN